MNQYHPIPTMVPFIKQKTIVFKKINKLKVSLCSLLSPVSRVQMTVLRGTCMEPLTTEDGGRVKEREGKWIIKLSFLKSGGDLHVCSLFAADTTVLKGTQWWKPSRHVIRRTVALIAQTWGRQLINTGVFGDTYEGSSPRCLMAMRQHTTEISWLCKSTLFIKGWPKIAPQPLHAYI